MTLQFGNASNHMTDCQRCLIGVFTCAMFVMVFVAGPKAVTGQGNRDPRYQTRTSDCRHEATAGHEALDSSLRFRDHQTRLYRGTRADTKRRGRCESKAAT